MMYYRQQQRRGNGTPRGHLIPKVRPITTAAINTVASKKKFGSAEAYYSREQLQRLLDTLNEKKQEAIESAQSCQETLHGGNIQTYGIHMDFGSEVQEREKAGMISSGIGRFGDALMRSEQMLKSAIALVERSEKK